jgi:hypothetical protein
MHGINEVEHDPIQFEKKQAGARTSTRPAAITRTKSRHPPGNRSPILLCFCGLRGFTAPAAGAGLA